MKKQIYIGLPYVNLRNKKGAPLSPLRLRLWSHLVDTFPAFLLDAATVATAGADIAATAANPVETTVDCHDFLFCTNSHHWVLKV